MFSSRKWKDLVLDNRIHNDYPPTEYTELLLKCACEFIGGMSDDYQPCVAELGAKDALICLYLSPFSLKAVATDISINRLDVINSNLNKAKCDFISLISQRDVWFPESYDWNEIDLFLINPPSIPDPGTIDVGDDHVYFSGPRGRKDIENILTGLKGNMKEGSSAIIVAAKYVTDGWLSEACSSLGMTAVKLREEIVPIEADDIDFKLISYVRKELEWDGYIVNDSNSSLAYLRAGWQIRHA